MSKCILLAEDDEDNRDLVSFILRRSQMDVKLIIAENGQQAIDLATTNKPDLILMDLQMPVLDGWKAIPRLKADERTRDIPIIAFTAQTSPADKARALELGCSAHVSKPMEAEELMRTIKQYLNP